MAEALKDSLFSRPQVEAQGEGLAGAHPGFDRAVFMRDVFDDAWAGRAPKDRMHHVTRVIHGLLPTDYRAALDVLFCALPTIGPIGGFINLVPSDFVELYGPDDWDASIPALEAFTQVGSAEYAVRPFIRARPQRMLPQMRAWADHAHPAVRRLASEGTRPLLPWGMALPDSRRTRPRSCRSSRSSKTTHRMTCGAASPITSTTSPRTLATLGFATEGAFEVGALTVFPDSVARGDEITISFEIESQAETPQELMIDCVVYHRLATSPQLETNHDPPVLPGSPRDRRAGEWRHLTTHPVHAHLTAPTEGRFSFASWRYC